MKFKIFNYSFSFRKIRKKRIEPNRVNFNDVELTYYLNETKGWDRGFKMKIDKSLDIIHLGKCKQDGNMFAVYNDTDKISIHKGYFIE